jgi:phosphate transport system substrate-binding protein
MTLRLARATGLLAIGAFVVFAGAVPSPSGLAGGEALVRTEGPGGLLPLASALRNAWREQSEDVEVTLGAGLEEKARLDALAAGAIDLAFADHRLDLNEVAVRGLTAQKLAVTAVVFAVHADVTVLDLMPNDLCDIYAGRIPTWAAYGGPALPIQPVLRPDAEADAEVARAAIPCMEKLTPGKAVVVARTASDMRVALQSTPGAIGLTTSAAVRQSIVALRALSIASVPPTAANVLSGRYPLVRPAYLVTLKEPPPAVVRFLAFARSDRGAAAILDAGLLPTR